MTTSQTPLSIINRSLPPLRAPTAAAANGPVPSSALPKPLNAINTSLLLTPLLLHPLLATHITNSTNETSNANLLKTITAGLLLSECARNEPKYLSTD